ncbi:MAG: hypothetical protein Q9195_005971 [Heterodermia aff. obscurata]
MFIRAEQPLLPHSHVWNNDAMQMEDSIRAAEDRRWNRDPKDRDAEFEAMKEKMKRMQQGIDESKQRKELNGRVEEFNKHIAAAGELIDRLRTPLTTRIQRAYDDSAEEL